jgi:hypothetical protein
LDSKVKKDYTKINSRINTNLANAKQGFIGREGDNENEENINNLLGHDQIER